MAVIQYLRFPGLLTGFSLGPLSAIRLITFLVESHETLRVEVCIFSLEGSRYPAQCLALWV